jgi:anti-sigma regulatory factor (Ser/Thr protein kinase)
METTPPSRWCTRATAEDVGRLRRAAAAAAAQRGLAGRSLDHFSLAVSEALTNAVVHAYPGEGPGPISLEVDGDSKQVRVTVRDEGRGMAVRSKRRGLGLGLELLASVSDFCEIRSVRGAGMRVRLGFDLETERSQPTSG